MTALELLALLVLGHYLADYPLQNEFMARGKSRTNPIRGAPWYQILTAHAVLHGGMVALAVVLAALSGNPSLFEVALPLAACETLVHWAIDDEKCRGKKLRGTCCKEADERPFLSAFNRDQAGHLLCKIAWTVIAATASGMPLVAR